MKVWILNHESYGDVSVYAEDTDVLKISLVEDELFHLIGEYADERAEFIEDVERARQRGFGSASIEERFTITLEEVR